MSLSNIEWTDYTWNPWRGCSKVSPGCANCYAERLVTTRLGGEWGPGKPRQLASEKILGDPKRWNKNPWVGDGDRHRARVFLGSLMDIADEEVPIERFSAAIATVGDCREIDFLIVTKRPELFMERLAHAAAWGREYSGRYTFAERWSQWLLVPSNVWMITSVENQEMLEERVPHLLRIPAAVHGLSCEPLLGPLEMDLTKPMPIHDDQYGDQHEYYEVKRGIDWVIAGGESGPGARPCNVDWIRSVRDQCQTAGVPVFVKQLGSNVPNIGNVPPEVLVPSRKCFKHPKGGDPAEWPADLRVREFPEVTR